MLLPLLSEHQKLWWKNGPFEPKINPYLGKWGVKWPPVHFCLCISETVRYTAMHFWDVVQDSEGYLSPYKVLSHLYQKCGRDGMKPEVRFRKSAKSRMPDCKSHDYRQQTLSSTTFIFSWASGLNLLLAWFLDVNIHCYLRPRKHVSCLWKFTDILLLPGYNYFRFRAWLWCHLSYLTSTCSTWCRFSFHWVHGHLKSLTGY